MKNREIKFRVWRPAINQMQMVTQIMWGDIVSHGKISYISTEQNDVDVNKIVLMQGTGINDKNGVEIFEYDIVKGNHKDNFIIVPILGGLSLHNTCYVGEGWNELIAHPTNDVQTASWLRDSEIIGNQYQNPELIKKTEKCEK